MRYPRPLSIVLAGALALGVAGVPMVTSAQAAQRTATAVRTVTDGVTTFAVVDNPGGPTLSYIPGGGITLLTESTAAGTLTFKDFDADGQLDAFEDWRKPVNERAKALAAVLSIEQTALFRSSLARLPHPAEAVPRGARAVTKSRPRCRCRGGDEAAARGPLRSG